MKKNKGFCWCVHHNILLAYCYDFKKRVEFIKGTKSANEILVRLYEMRLVKGELPAEITKAGAKQKKACINCKDIDLKREKIFLEWRKARIEYQRAKDEGEKIIRKYRVVLEELHKKEVPDTCWNGKELDFTKKRNEK